MRSCAESRSCFRRGRAQAITCKLDLDENVESIEADSGRSCRDWVSQFDVMDAMPEGGTLDIAHSWRPSELLLRYPTLVLESNLLQEEWPNGFSFVRDKHTTGLGLAIVQSVLVIMEEVSVAKRPRARS